ncbi:threonine/serine exporter family protein [Bacillus salitolerans]|uniref:Threonine/serine exporter family protein n=1 Tax=Bacillus salitolerans TaxID=1437434 RepID=A0ABW4LIH0_9BACI
MEQQDDQLYKVIEVCLLAGKLMLQNGGETYRVEDTMTRIAASNGIKDSHSFVTPTGIIFSMDGRDPTKFIRIVDRSTDLQKIAIVNNISRKISDGKISIDEAYEELKEVEHANLMYPAWVQILSAAFVSGCFLIMFQGKWFDFFAAFFAGAGGYAGLLYFNKVVQIKFFSEFTASLIIGFLSLFFITIGFGHDLDKIIIGSVMPLVPGVLITNAVRDLMAGHLVSGLSKGAEAFLTAFAIGAGVAVVISLL